MRDIYFVLKYELFKFFKTARGYILLLTGTVPIIIFLSITAEKYRLEFLVSGDMAIIQNALLVAYVFYSYIIMIFFTIMVYSDILTNEKSYEFLLVSTSRASILLGKVLTSIILNIILIFETMIAFILTLVSYKVFIPHLDLLALSFLISFTICVFLVIPVILISNTLIIKIGGLASSMANYLAIFIFFVIPFIIYFSLFELSLFQPAILNYSIHTFVQNFVYSFFITSSIPKSQIEVQNSILSLILFGVAGYIVSFILFLKSSIIN